MQGAIAMPPKCSYDWEAEEDFNAVCRAAAVNKDPKRLAKVKTLAKTKLQENKNRRDQAQAMVDMGEGKNP
jgi:hypothetical protein